MTADDVMDALAAHAKPDDAVFLQRFFKTGPGQYGAGDVFIGVRVPQTRAICKQFRSLPLGEVQKLFNSKVHEHRLAAGILLSYQYPKAPDKQAVYELYLKNARGGRVNNWDIVDTTAECVIGRHLWETGAPRDVLFELAHSNNLWHKRIGILSSFYFVRQGDPITTLTLAEVLVHDPHDLIQKAVGWMLREVGKRADRKLLTGFLDSHAATMPRTALRYAVEHLPAEQKLYYMSLKKGR